MEHVTEGCTCEGKKCIGCQDVRCFGHFGLRKKDRPIAPTNLNSYCRPCNSQRGGEAIKQRRRENTKKWNKAHPEQARAHVHKWQKSHPDAVKEFTRRNNRRRRKVNPDGERERNRNWHRVQRAMRNEAYLAKANVNQKKTYLRRKAERPEKHQEIFYFKSLRRRARKSQAIGMFTAQQWRAVKEKYDYTCLRCGKREPEIKLTADHIMPLTLGGTNFIEKNKPLCKPCNSKKGVKFIDFRTKTP